MKKLKFQSRSNTLLLLIVLGVGIIIGLTSSRFLPLKTKETQQSQLYDMSDWKTFTNTAWKYSFKYPPTYQVFGENMGPVEENIMILVRQADIDNNLGESNYPSMNIWWQFNDMPNSPTAKEYAQNLYKYNSGQNLKEIELNNSTAWSFSLNTDWFIVDGFTDSKKQSGFRVKEDQYKAYLVEADSGYLIIVHTDNSTFNQIFSTMRFGN